MTQMPETLSVLLDGNKSADLQVEEFHPLEPSNYCYDPGYTCWDTYNDKEYFVSLSGDVYEQPSNRVVGVCPALREAADRLEAQLEEAYESDMDAR